MLAGLRRQPFEAVHIRRRTAQPPALATHHFRRFRDRSTYACLVDAVAKSSDEVTAPYSSLFVGVAA
jgi:hypothetical protein